jgi:NitT/TauT family transport system substrate-binding protein
MRTQDERQLSRRRFLGGLTLAGTAGLLGLHPRPIAAEPPPETTTLRLTRIPTICAAPQYVAEALLQSEGFTEVSYVTMESGAGVGKALASGTADLAILGADVLTPLVDGAQRVVVLAGIHVGCYELFGHAQVRSIRDLKGQTLAVPALGSGRHLFLAILATSIGLDPRSDIHWLERPTAEAMQLFVEGQLAAFLGFPPEPQELRAQQIGSVVLNTAVDRPWSQYFCCMFAGNREFIHKHPVATKRALRAILKATDLCAAEPERAARFLVDKGYTARYDFALQTLRELPYTRWREYNPEDTMRYFALRLHEAGMIKSSPQKIIARGTDWHFLNELKKELKG